MVVLTAQIYYRERRQSTVSKGKRHMGHSLEEARPASKTPVPVESHRRT